jgi:hypothetical protein
MILFFVSKKEVRHGYRRGGGRLYFANLDLNFLYLSYIFIKKKNPIFLYNFGQILTKVAWRPVNLYEILVTWPYFPVSMTRIFLI